MAIASTMREMTEEELSSYLQEAYRELLGLRFNFALTRSIQKPAKIRQLRRSIARVLTIQRESGFAVGPTMKMKSLKKTKRSKKS